MNYGQYQKLGSKTLNFMLYQKITVYFLILFMIIGLGLAFNHFDIKINIINSSFFTTIFHWLLLIWFIVTGLSILVVYLQYNTYRIMVTDDSLKINRGIFNREELSIPFSRIESVEIKQSLDKQIFGVSYLTITQTNDLEQLTSQNPTSTQQLDNNEEIIPIIDNALALELQDILSQKANISKIKIQN